MVTFGSCPVPSHPCNSPASERLTLERLELHGSTRTNGNAGHAYADATTWLGQRSSKIGCAGAKLRPAKGRGFLLYMVSAMVNTNPDLGGWCSQFKLCRRTRHLFHPLLLLLGDTRTRPKIEQRI